MPFDCTPVIDPPKQFSLISGSGVEVRFLSITAPTTTPSRAHYRNMSREAAATATAVLTRARDLISDERRWCKGTLARGWLDVPVSIHSRFARRFCAIGAITAPEESLDSPLQTHAARLSGRRCEQYLTGMTAGGEAMPMSSPLSMLPSSPCCDTAPA